MADNGLTVLDAAGATKTLRSLDVGGGVNLQLAGVQLPETSLRSSTASDHRFTVDASGAKALIVANLPEVPRFARVRIYHSAQDGGVRCYYVTDGTTPTSNGANALGFMLHGEQIIVTMADLTKFEMIGESGMAGSFQAYVEYVTWH